MGDQDQIGTGEIDKGGDADCHCADAYAAKELMS